MNFFNAELTGSLSKAPLWRRSRGVFSVFAFMWAALWDGVLLWHNSDLLTLHFQFVLIWFGRITVLVKRLQMGLLIFSFEGKVDWQMEGNDAAGREQLGLRRPLVSQRHHFTAFLHLKLNGQGWRETRRTRVQISETLMPLLLPWKQSSNICMTLEKLSLWHQPEDFQCVWLSLRTAAGVSALEPLWTSNSDMMANLLNKYQ